MAGGTLGVAAGRSCEDDDEEGPAAIDVRLKLASRSLTLLDEEALSGTRLVRLSSPFVLLCVLDGRSPINSSRYRLGHLPELLEVDAEALGDAGENGLKDRRCCLFFGMPTAGATQQMSSTT